MEEFHKRLVRVEWLAFQKAADLMREAGLDNSYFVSESWLTSDEGQALADAERGKDFYDSEGQLVKTEKLSAKDFGLTEEIGEFAQSACGVDAICFLKRGYMFRISRKGDKHTEITVHVIFAKRNEQDDWELVHEALVDANRSGYARWIICRPKS